MPKYQDQFIKIKITKMPAIDRKELYSMLLINLLALVVVVVLVIAFGHSDNGYLRFLWNDDLAIMGVAIDTWQAYVVLLLAISIVVVCDTLVSELGTPVLNFIVYNPDKECIPEFGKNELLWCTVGMFAMRDIRRVITVLLSISQIDIALFSIFISKAVTVLTVNHLLEKKRFEQISKGSNHIPAISVTSSLKMKQRPTSRLIDYTDYAVHWNEPSS